MSANVKKKMFEKIEEKVRNISVLLLMKLRVEMLQHLVFKREFMDASGKIEKARAEEKEIRNVIGEVEEEIRQMVGKIKEKRKEVEPIER